MTNLEFYRDEIIEKNKSVDAGRYFECVLCEVRNKIYDCRKPCYQCLEESVDWLLKEHCENIKLTQWEYDLLVLESKNYSPLSPFDSYPVLDEMKRKGYFQGIPNVKLTITNILNNCEVVEDE